MVQQGSAPVAGGLEDGFFALAQHDRRSAGIAVGQIPGHGKLVLRVFRQGNADGLADTLGQERGDGHAALDAAAVTVAGLRHAHMQGEHHAPLLHAPGQLPVGIHHHHGIGSLQGHHHIVKTGLYAHIYPFHGGQGHGLGGVSVLFHDILAQGTVIQANADGPVMLLAKLQELPEEGPGLLMVRMEVAGIDANLLHHGDHRHGNLGGEVDIGHQGRLNALRTQLRVNLPEMGHIGHGGDSNADKLGPGGSQAPALGHGGLNIGSAGVAHGLHHNGVPASHDNGGTYADLAGL